MTQWYETSCPHCNATNWVDGSDDYDPADAVRCHKCARSYWFHEDTKHFLGTSEDDPDKCGVQFNEDSGRPSPSYGATA